MFVAIHDEGERGKRMRESYHAGADHLSDVSHGLAADPEQGRTAYDYALESFSFPEVQK